MKKGGKGLKSVTEIGDNFTYAKVPPHDADIEKAVLGAILLTNCLDDIEQYLNSDVFYVPQNRLIFEAIKQVKNIGKPIDILTVTSEAREMGILDEIGGVTCIVELTSSLVSNAHTEHHACILYEKYMLRETIKLSNQAVTDSYSGGADPFDIINNLDSSLTALSTGNVSKPYSVSAELARIALDDLDKIINNKEVVTGVPTGFKRIDELTNGFQAGNLIIIAARPSVGKTAFVQNILLNAVSHSIKPVPVGMFSMEMSKLELMKRWLSGMSNVELRHINSGRLDQSEIDRYSKAASEFSNLKLFVDDEAALNIYQLRAKARKMKQKHDVQLIAIDYLQLMSGVESGRNSNREQEISKISRDLKALGKELNIPIIALSQLSRAVESRSDKTPQLSDLRESGAIEQDADCVMFLTRPDYQKTVDEMGYESINDNADIHIRKNRMGCLDDIPMYFVKDIQKWFDKDGYNKYKDINWHSPPQFNNPMVGISSRNIRDFTEPNTDFILPY